jgi:hypothetical protein
MEIGILKDIVIIFALSTFVNFIFTRIKIPAIIAYLPGKPEMIAVTVDVLSDQQND